MTRARLLSKCQVLIVGAGPGGLVAGITLAGYGIEVLVIDRRHDLSGLSRSLVISTRGMELMRRFGIEREVREGAADVAIRAWITAALSSDNGREAPLGYPSDEEAAQVSPSRPAWVAQDHHEPVLVERLRRQPTAALRFDCELLEVVQDGAAVRAVVRDLATGAVEHLQASYLIAADGAHSTVREQLGIRMVGPDNLADYERVEFTAPLWPLVRERRYGLYVITRPDAAGVLTPRGAGDRWGMSRETPVGAPSLLDLDERELTTLIQRAAGSDMMRPRIERVSAFTFAAQLADRYQSGRCFLVGDAAHRMTPRGGTGMNTAIQDAFDLGWKLAWVVRRWATPELLSTFEKERRPVAAHNVERAGAQDGAQRATDDALPWDLGGRIPHHWMDTGQGRVSTLDLIGDRLTLLTGSADPRWARAADQMSTTAPVDVQTLDRDAASALDLSTNGALLARPDGNEVRRWTHFVGDQSLVPGSPDVTPHQLA
ncbi:MAG TPA: FAD-dependent monooxygenase [Mycobacteriales bacterium]|jgi:2-polyprenyl-6-methoxyphenol hydroxylase-like FAD-dependent oxidoreductase|nr:FAD-dependent monooxygenase [Mycobacteriales bacterium]